MTTAICFGPPVPKSILTDGPLVAASAADASSNSPAPATIIQPSALEWTRSVAMRFLVVISPLERLSLKP